MTYERAAEILDPEHRETYESLEIVNEACRMGRAALFRRMPEPPHPDGDESILACPTCGSGEYLYNEDGNRCCFCGWCGQAIDWNAETFKAAGQMKPVLKYPGSKWRLAEWIVSLMPPHKSYLEPFFGSGAVFFKKPPSRIETINDLDGEIINLFRCIREQPEELMRAVACTPYSRGEYEQAWDHFKAGGQVRPDGIEAARLTLVRYWQAHGSTVVYKGGWKNDRAGREYAYDVRYWRQLPERIAAVVERLKDAQIEQAPAVDVIRRFRHPDVLIYADPPYMLHTRKGKQYIVEMAEEAGMTVDQEGFKALMEEQKVRARKAREALGDLGWAGIEFGKDMPATEFVGYDRSSEQGRVLALVADGELRDELAQGVEGILVLDQTPFYAEMGGQVGDHGTIQGPNGTFQVTDVQKNKGGKFMHSGKVVSGTLSVGETVTASIDMERRKAIMRAHSATHLLDAALKKVLGDHVHQAGSLVEPDRLRFDFTHFEAITPEQLAQIDKLVNDAILEGYPVATEVLPIEEAKKKGAVAMFGEKYGDIVRVVEMGDFSMEFCGGTHLDNTAKAGPFRIKSEGSVASGVRRIEATVGRLSLDTMNRNQELLFHAAQVLKTTPGELAAKAEQQAAEMKELRHELEKFKSEASLGEARQFLTAAKNVGGLKVLTAIRNGMDANALRQMGDFLRDKAPDVVAVLASANGEKITFLAVCGPEAVKRGIKAGDLVKSVCAICGGKGGGKPDSAMGGGSDLLKLDDALATVDDFVAEKLK